MPSVQGTLKSTVRPVGLREILLCLLGGMKRCHEFLWGESALGAAGMMDSGAGQGQS